MKLISRVQFLRRTLLEKLGKREVIHINRQGSMWIFIITIICIYNIRNFITLIFRDLKHLRREHESNSLLVFYLLVFY